MAIKIMYKENMSARATQQLRREIMSMKNLTHPNILRLKDVNEVSCLKVIAKCCTLHIQCMTCRVRKFFIVCVFVGGGRGGARGKTALHSFQSPTLRNPVNNPRPRLRICTELHVHKEERP